MKLTLNYCTRVENVSKSHSERWTHYQDTQIGLVPNFPGNNTMVVGNILMKYLVFYKYVGLRHTGLEW